MRQMWAHTDTGAALMFIDLRDPEYREYVMFWNAVAGALIDYAADNGLERPCFSQRKDIASRAWRNLYPDSKYGADK